tara:strand:+ start:316 stop:693 length:378 start_codon:yes stop_codon:yes gene_type:complete
VINREGRAIKYIYIALGILSVILGLIGALLPIIPTTPFLLVASYFFTRSSKRLNDLLYKNRYLGPYLQSISSGNGMPLVAKIYTISLLWFFMLVSIFMIDFIAIKITLFVIASGVTIYVSSLKTA